MITVKMLASIVIIMIQNITSRLGFSITSFDYVHSPSQARLPAINHTFVLPLRQTKKPIVRNWVQISFVVIKIVNEDFWRHRRMCIGGLVNS